MFVLEDVKVIVIQVFSVKCVVFLININQVVQVGVCSLMGVVFGVILEFFLVCSFEVVKGCFINVEDVVGVKVIVVFGFDFCIKLFFIGLVIGQQLCIGN